MELVDNLKDQIKIYISGRKLKNLDILTKSDPKCEVYEMRGSEWVKIGSTETINNDLNPNFTKAVPMTFYFEKIQKLKFKIMDSDDQTADDLIGEYETTVGALMGA